MSEGDPMSETLTSVRVEIAGEAYTLRTDADKAHTLRCAAIVDERMRQIGGDSPVEKKTAIMAALSLSNDLLQHQSRARARARDFAQRLEEALDS